MFLADVAPISPWPENLWVKEEDRFEVFSLLSRPVYPSPQVRFQRARIMFEGICLLLYPPPFSERRGGPLNTNRSNLQLKPNESGTGGKLTLVR